MHRIVDAPREGHVVRRSLFAETLDRIRVVVPHHVDLAAVGVVGVHHAAASLFIAVFKELEEPLLGVEIMFKIMVKIEVVPRQVGEHGGVEIDVIGPPQFQGVGRNLHDDGVDTVLHHTVQDLLEVPRFRGRVRRRHLPSAPPVIDGADNAGITAVALHDGFEHVGDRRLAVGAGNADGQHGAGRKPEEGRRQAGQGRPGVAGGQQADTPVLQPAKVGKPIPGDTDRRSAVIDRCINEAVPVAGKTLDGDKKATLPDLTGVVFNGGDNGATAAHSLGRAVCTFRQLREGDFYRSIAIEHPLYPSRVR